MLWVPASLSGLRAISLTGCFGAIRLKADWPQSAFKSRHPAQKQTVNVKG
jgi:hypothetical protein